MLANKYYVIFNVSEINKIEFDKVLETSAETLRKSVDETKTFVKYIGDEPYCVSILTTKEGPYTYEEIINILSTEEWTKPLDKVL